jgi:RimJ/RimL family protein N-acetyltransferase
MVANDTDRLVVRSIGVEDAETFADLVGRSRLSVEVVREKLAGIDELTVQQRLAFIGIFRKSNDMLLGHSVVSRAKDTESADVDYWMGEGFRALGYMREAAPAVINVAERVLGISAFEAIINVGNLASAAVARRMGMALVATEERTVNGRSWTELRFGRGVAAPSGSGESRET